MASTKIIIQLVIALTIINVWLVRKGKPTKWRGGGATNMEEEFEVYGLSKYSMVIIGCLKVFLAALLLAGIWFPPATTPAAVVLGLLMLGAVLMHIKVRDPLKKSLPAFTLLCLCVGLVLLT